MGNVKLITRQLGKELIEQIESATSICILTAFTMKSGVSYIKEALKQAAQRGADIKICTGDYLYITQPDALASLIEIDDNIEIRLWRSGGTSFHPKAYIFQNDYQDYFFVGSSNLSRAALHNGIEWNVAVHNEKELIDDALQQFLTIFYDKNTIPLNKTTWKTYEEKYQKYHTKHPNLVKQWTNLEEQDLMLPTESDVTYSYQKKIPKQIIEEQPIYGDVWPRQAQFEALEQLDRTIEEGYDKALVVMATGLGKTFLSGFFARKFQRVLFIAHREEILHQSKRAFHCVMPNKSSGIFDGKTKDSDKELVFASIFTLSMKKYLSWFSKDAFDLIIIDEFHHAAAKSYQRVLDYFQPSFLLGITATPDRNDNKDVYAICDGNVAYRIDFLQAIERKWLAPFVYYGVYDDIDYSQITWLGHRYDEQQLLQAQLRDDLAKKILHVWEEKKQTRTLGFCSSIKQADFLSSFFNQYGYKTVSLHSRQVEIGREDAILMLENAEIDVIFTVDLFNEGVDIPSVDTLLFVRPTESLTVFTQQLGRGLRLHENKEHCVIIDLIGNYRNADLKLSLFDTAEHEVANICEPAVPQFCKIELDLKVINLCKEMQKKQLPKEKQVQLAFLDLKTTLGRRPTYVEFDLYVKIDPKVYKESFDSSYYEFLQKIGEFAKGETKIYKKYKKWLNEIETTDMNKSYKMVVLLAMLERGISKWYQPVSAKEIAPFFHRYLTSEKYRKHKDFSGKSNKKLWVYNEKGIANLIERMPMTYWSKTSNDLVSFRDRQFSFRFNVAKEDEAILHAMTKDICLYRLHDHFVRRM